MAMKKGPTKGSGGKHRNSLRGKGPTPKAEDRVYHKAYKEKQATNRRKMADPRLAARRRAAKFSSESDDLVIGRNAVLEALRCGVPASTLYVAARIEHDDRTREIIRLAGIHGLNLMEADRSAEPGRGHPFRGRIRRERRDPTGTSLRFSHRSRMEGVRRSCRTHACRPRGEPHQSH